MSNSIKGEFDKVSMIKDIKEIDSIVFNYQRYGLLDRNEAIRKIKELRITDKDITDATIARLTVSSTPFCQSTNDQIVGELLMQRNILLAKLIKKQTE